MHAEADKDPAERYLICKSFFSDKLIARVKEDVKTFMSKRDKDDLYYQFIDWQKQENELLVFTTYAYADIPLPKSFDTVFDVANLENVVTCNLAITQVVFNGWAAMDEISCGHKHIAVLRFEDKIPAIFGLLPQFDKDEPNKSTLGFCSEKDFIFIKDNIKNRASEVIEE